MPQNKNFQKRVTILDECFANRSGSFTLKKLIDTVYERLGINVSRETIQGDIRYIRDEIQNNFGHEIDFEKEPVFIEKLFEGKKKVFKYSDPKFALGNHLLSKSDQEQLEDTLAVLSRYRNREDFYWLDELFPRIESAFDIVHEDYSSLISYQSNRDYTGQPWVGKLYNQLLRKKVLKVEYKGFKDDESYIRVIHPYHLKQYNNRWFLFGLQESNRFTGITNLALDRIINITETSENIIEDNRDWGDYFDKMIGVSSSQNTNEVLIKLRFSEHRINYVLTKPIHGASQRLDRSDLERRTIIVELLPNREFYQVLLSFGKDIEVLEPKWIVEEFKNILEEMVKKYD